MNAISIKRLSLPEDNSGAFLFHICTTYCDIFVISDIQVGSVKINDWFFFFYRGVLLLTDWLGDHLLKV